MWKFTLRSFFLACHVLDCPQNLSYDVINTIGQAFELRYKMFLDNPPELLPVPQRLDTVNYINLPNVRLHYVIKNKKLEKAHLGVEFHFMFVIVFL